VTQRAWHFDHAKTAFGWRWMLFRDGLLVGTSTIDYTTPDEMMTDMRTIANCFNAVNALHAAGVKASDVRVTDKEPQ
jgi:hypothetical protein